MLGAILVQATARKCRSSRRRERRTARRHATVVAAQAVRGHGGGARRGRRWGCRGCVTQLGNERAQAGDRARICLDRIRGGMHVATHGDGGAERVRRSRQRARMRHGADVRKGRTSAAAPHIVDGAVEARIEQHKRREHTARVIEGVGQTFTTHGDVGAESAHMAQDGIRRPCPRSLPVVVRRRARAGRRSRAVARRRRGGRSVAVRACARGAAVTRMAPRACDVAQV